MGAATAVAIAGVLLFSGALPFAGAAERVAGREDGDFTAALTGAAAFEGDAFVFAEVVTAGVLTFEGFFAAGLVAALAAETLFGAVCLDAGADDVTALVGDEADFLAGARLVTGAAVGTGADFAFEFAVLATASALDDLTFFAAIFSILEKSIKTATSYTIPMLECQSLIGWKTGQTHLIFRI